MWLWRTSARSPALPPRLAPLIGSSRATYGEEVQRRVEVPFLELEVGGRDRRREAVVEGLGQAEALVHAVPTELDRQLVRAQLAGVEEAEQLDPGEMPRAERPELLGPVLVHVPGVVRLLRPGRGQGQQVRGRDVG